MKSISKQELLKQKEVLEKDISYLESINKFASDLLHANTIEDVLWLITSSITSKFNFEDCVVYLKSDDHQHLEKVASHSGNETAQRIIKYPMTVAMGQGIVGYVAKTGEPELISDTREDARYIPDDSVRLSELAVPIKLDDEVFGVIDSEHSNKGFYDESHLYPLIAIADLSAAKIKNLQIAADEYSYRKSLEESESGIKAILNGALDAVPRTDTPRTRIR